MIQQTKMYFYLGLMDREEKDLLISVGLVEEGDFERRKIYDEWWLTPSEIDVNITLPMLFKLSKLFPVLVCESYIELSN